MPTYFLAAPAKVNLVLQVLGRRADGFHDIASLMVAIDLCDLVRVRPRPGPVACDCPGVALADNLAVRAAEDLGVQAELAIDKRIPAGAGLGGGSSDAAAVLRALGAGHRLDVARRLGADVPFFLFGGPAWATGVGTDLQPVDDLPDFSLVLCLPVGRALETGTMYRALGRPQHAEPPPLPPIFDRSLDRLAAHVMNDFEEVAGERVGLVGRALAALRGAGARAATVTGKGPATFGLFATLAEAEAAAVRLREVLPADEFQVLAVRGLSRLTRPADSSI
ncbi:MAG: 4-(cytidine 5'-diphospho)-2-C-methyl-D-erythritol kinase [Myxococcota bacterium]